MRWAILCVLALQLPVDPAPQDADARERRREAIETMNSGVESYLNADLEDAERALKRAVELDPTYSRAHVNLGRLHAAFENVEDAVDEFERAIELMDPIDVELRAEVHYDLGRILLTGAKMGAESPSELGQTERRELVRQAAVALAEATRIERPDYRAHHLRGRAHDLLDQPVEADLGYRACIATQPLYSACYIDLARLYFDYGASSLAQVVLETATQVNDADPVLWLAYAELQLDLGQSQQAVDAAIQAQRLDPQLVEVDYVLGRAYVALRMRAEALESLNRYMQRRSSDRDDRSVVASTLLFHLEDPI